ncbi:MAG TPA: 4a-hydroxytetrahydrobiopterin dehydratase [Balneolaceae bacterium]|nr:4a-hydroxytetrahydrobiopterin dehydratase [Balneolaceae bacterium]
MAEPLSEEKISKELDKLPGWEYKDDKLSKEFSFDNFRDALSYITRIGFEAEEQVHHPEIFNVYNTVNISLSTHDAGGKVTAKDIKLAKTIESLYNK